MSVNHWPKVSRHRSKDVVDHALAIGAELDAFEESRRFKNSRLRTLPTSLCKLISKGISQALAEASSIGYPLSLTSESDRQLLQDITLKHIAIQAAAKARDRVPLGRHIDFAETFRDFLPKLLAWDAERKNRIPQLDVEVPEAQELGLAPSAAVQEVHILGNTDACAAPLQGKQVVALLKDITYDDRLGMDEAEGYDEADGEDDNQVEEGEEVDVTGEVKDATNPRQQAVNNDIYDPEKTPYQREPLANKFQITFKITSQAVVNVLYDMDPWDLRKAVCGAIKKKRHPTRDFSGTSYLSDVSLLNSGDISAITFNEKQEDISLLLQMSDWDRDIVDHEVGINFGTHWCYPVHMKGVKESSLSGELSSRRQKAALIRELVCISTTTLTSLRIHHIKDVHYLRDSEEGSEVLAIEFFEFEQAHAALSRGLSYNGKHFVCDTLEKIKFLARCGNCQAYGHGSGACSDPPRCGKCTERHRTKFCRSLLEKCALCDGRHASNSPKCQVKQAERNSVGFVPVSSRRPQATINAETAVSIQRSSHNHNAAKSDVEPNCCQHADALKQVEESLKEMREVLRCSISADARNTIEGRSQKRAALEPLINGASNNPGRPAKRAKQEEQQKTETMDLYRIPSPYIVHRD